MSSPLLQNTARPLLCVLIQCCDVRRTCRSKSSGRPLARDIPCGSFCHPQFHVNFFHFSYKTKHFLRNFTQIHRCTSTYNNTRTTKHFNFPALKSAVSGRGRNESSMRCRVTLWYSHSCPRIPTGARFLLTPLLCRKGEGLRHWRPPFPQGSVEYSSFPPKVRTAPKVIAFL